MKLFSLFISFMLVFTSLSADAARRLGGGGSMGKQSSNVTQRQQNTVKPTTPNNNQQQNVNKPTVNQSPNLPTPVPAPKRQWGSILGGVAAGAGLAWLLGSSGGSGAGTAAAAGSSGMGGVLMLLLLAGAAYFMWSLYKRSRQSGINQYAYGNATSGSANNYSYSPKNVGNDASARPWETQNTTGSMIGAGVNQSNNQATFDALSGSQTWGIPANFDTPGFISAAKRNFAILQTAWDKSDVDTLRAMMTDEMASEIKNQLASRAKEANGSNYKTEIMSLDAQLLGIEDLGDEYLASVEFNGVIQETPFEGPQPFREVWNMSKAKTGSSGWLVAGVQALQ